MPRHGVVHIFVQGSSAWTVGHPKQRYCGNLSMACWSSKGVSAWPAGRPSPACLNTRTCDTTLTMVTKSPCRNCSTDSDSVCMTPHSIAPHTQHTSRDAQTDHCGNASHTTCSHNSHNNKRVTSPRHRYGDIQTHLQEDHHP